MKYQKRILSPLLDRIDVHIEVPRVDYEKLSSDRLGEISESICKRVQAARNIEQQRFARFGTYDIYNRLDVRTTAHLTSFATRICASGRYGNFASCRMKALH
jgi:predicted ATPase with chaperone activity